MFGIGLFGAQLFADSQSEELDLSDFWLNKCATETIYTSNPKMSTGWTEDIKVNSNYTHPIKDFKGITRCE